MSSEAFIRFHMPPFPYYVESGKQIYPIGETHPNRQHIGVFDLIYVMSGTLHIGEEDTAYALTSGDSLILSPDRWHYSLKPCETVTTFYWVHFRSGEGWEEGFYEQGGGGMPIQLPKLWKVSDPELMGRLMNLLIELSKESRATAYWEEQKTFLELLQLMNEGGHPVSSSQAVTVASRAEAYLKQHYRSDLSNQSMSEALHFHPNYLARCMKEVYGVTPLEFLQCYRIDQAKLLLLKTEWAMPTIAEYVGFHYAPYFSTIFKKRVGLSPLAYRKQYQG